MTDVPTTLMNMVPTIVAADVVTRTVHAATKRPVRVVKVKVVKKAIRKTPKIKYHKIRRSLTGRTVISKNVYKSKSGGMSHRKSRGSKRVRFW